VGSRDGDFQTKIGTRVILTGCRKAGQAAVGEFARRSRLKDRPWVRSN
jgi:hypothetical protein